MRLLKLPVLSAAFLTVLSLCAAEVNMVMSLDVAALMAHPQFVKLRGEFDREAAAAGAKSSSDQLAEAKMDESLLKECRVTAYLNADSREGIVVIDAVEGQAQKWFDLLGENFGFVNGGTRTTIAGCPALTGTISEGQRGTILLKSPSQVQILLGEALALPLNVGGINKNLLLAARSNRLFTLAVIPPSDANASPQMMLPFQSLQLVTFGLENTVPEATISFEGLFASNNAALQARDLFDMMLLGLMQNPAVDPRLLQGIECVVDHAKLICTRKVDDGLVAALKELVLAKLLNQIPEQVTAGESEQTAPEALPSKEAIPVPAGEE